MFVEKGSLVARSTLRPAQRKLYSTSSIAIFAKNDAKPAIPSTCWNKRVRFLLGLLGGNGTSESSSQKTISSTGSLKSSEAPEDKWKLIDFTADD